MNGKEFEELCIYSASKLKSAHKFTMRRYGVQGVYTKSPGTGRMEWRPIQSYPDFEGVLPPNGRQVIFDCKVSGGASLTLSGGGARSLHHQYTHMRERCQYGALCFFLVHFTRRMLKSRVDEPVTYAIPVTGADSDVWAQYERQELKSISRNLCQLYGIEVPWITYPRGRKESPDLMHVINTMLKPQTEN